MIVAVEDVKLSLASVGKNVVNLAIINSTVLKLKPSNIADTFSPNALILNGSMFVNDRILAARKTIVFHTKQPMSLLVIEKCTIAFGDKTSFIKSTALNVKVVKNKFSSAESLKPGMDITGNNIVFKQNKIDTTITGKIKLMTIRSLKMEANTFKENKTEALDLTFPKEQISSISLTDENLGRTKKNFIVANVSSIIIKNCYVELDEENSFIINAHNFTLANSEVDTMKRNAMNIQADETIQIQGNTFVHCQKKAFFKILPRQNSTKVIFINNFFVNFEKGFLQPPEIEYNLNNLELSNITLNEDCSCHLAHNIIAEPKELLMRLATNEEMQKLNLSLVHKTSVQSHLDLEKLLVHTINCIDTNSSELTDLLSHSTCFQSNQTESMNLPAEPDMLWVLWVMLGLVAALAMAMVVFLMVRTKVLEKRAMGR